MPTKVPTIHKSGKNKIQNKHFARINKRLPTIIKTPIKPAITIEIAAIQTFDAIFFIFSIIPPHFLLTVSSSRNRTSAFAFSINAAEFISKSAFSISSRLCSILLKSVFTTAMLLFFCPSIT